MNRKNFHRMPDPRKAVEVFLKTESEKGNKVYWDRGHIQSADNSGNAHDNPGVGIYCVSCKARDPYDEKYSYDTRFMLLKSEADIENMFTYYEDNE